MTALGARERVGDRVRHHRATGRQPGVVAGLNRLHSVVSPGVLPAGVGGWILLPTEVVAVCDEYETPDGPRRRAGAAQERLGSIGVGGRELAVLRIAGAGPSAGSSAGPGAVGGWLVALGWYRLGLADRLLGEAITYLRGRSARGTVLADRPWARAAIGDAAGAAAQAGSLLESGPSPAALRQAHRALTEAGDACLRLFGATGFLVDGPGSEIRASELLADTYTPSIAAATGEARWP